MPGIKLTWKGAGSFAEHIYKEDTAVLHPPVQLQMQHLFIYRREAAERMRLDLSQHAITQRIHLDLAVNNLVNLGRRLQSD